MLCVAAASEVSRDVEEGVESLEPWVREIPLEGPCDVDGASMVEIHLGESTDFDPFKVFFQKPENEQAFDRAVLGNSKVSPELDQLQDDYKPSGYREKLENGCPFLNLEEASFVCRCCKAGFASRNRLFSHIRGSSTCMRFVAETDLRGFESLKEVKPQIYALIFGLPVAMTWSEVKEMLLGTLALVGENIQLITHEHQGSLAKQRRLLSISCSHDSCKDVMCSNRKCLIAAFERDLFRERTGFAWLCASEHLRQPNRTVSFIVVDNHLEHHLDKVLF